MRRLRWALVWALAASCTDHVVAIQVCGDAAATVDGALVNLAGDPFNCGCVGHRCPAGRNGSVACIDARCVAICKPGWADCDQNPENGCEQSVEDVNHCGACGTPCVVPNGQPSCQGGACTVLACAADFADCNRNVSDGCEADLRTTGTCGMCNVRCAVSNGVAACRDRVCAVDHCNGAFQDCDGLVGTGCEADTNTDPDRCGSCDIACSRTGGTPVCTAGQCQTRCGAGRADCDSDPSTGCEADLLFSTANCGRCGTNCRDLARANTNAFCESGACVERCLDGFGNCDGNAANGCEQTFATDVNHCGACGRRCAASVAHVVEVACNSGVCDYRGACERGYGDCDGNRQNGCETSLTTLDNCGRCGARCSLPNANPTCAGGSCAVATCNGGWGDCNAGDGCETQLNTLSNCGACNRACVLSNASSTCASGACRVASCGPNWGNCNGRDDDGCESNLLVPQTCGRCNNNCDAAIQNAYTSCSGTTCSYGSCRSNFADCDGNRANGCEVNLMADATNCGSCGNRCRAGHACQAGRCLCNAGENPCPSGATSYCGAISTACCDSSFPSFCDHSDGNLRCWSGAADCRTMRMCSTGMYAGRWRACNVADPGCNPCP